MTNNLPNSPIRKVELQIRMTDPDNHTMSAKAYIEESQLTDIRFDPRDLLFKALQDMSYKIVSEAFPIATTTRRLQSLREDYDTAIEYKEN